MNTVVSMLLAIINSSFGHDIYYDIAMKILEYCENPHQLSLLQLSKECYTTTATINKFCKALGFSNFSEFKFNYVNGYQTRREQMRFRLSKMNDEEMIEHISFIAEDEFDVEKFKNSIDNVTEYIHQSQKILILGAVFPTALTIHFQEDMIMMGKLIYGCSHSKMIQLENLSQDTLVFMVSLTGRLYEFMKNDFHRLCSKQDHIVLLSGYRNYPHYDSICEIVHIPIREDNEIGNVLILEIFRYIKYVYFKKYIKEF